MKAWTVRDAKARFSALLDICRNEGPQLITRGGEEVAVLIPVAQWERLGRTTKPTLKELLLTDVARTDDLVPPRRKWRRSSP